MPHDLPGQPGSTRSTADLRRVAVLAAAVQAFARTGYQGTSVRTVAGAAGISEAYAFRLFETKQGLFVATLRHCYDQVQEALRQGADATGSSRPRALLGGMADAYAQLISQRDLLMIQVHALAASNDPVIRAEMRRAQRDLVLLVQSRSGAKAVDVQDFFARGQLCHLVTALGIAGEDAQTPVPPEEPWMGVLAGGIRHLPARPPPA